MPQPLSANELAGLTESDRDLAKLFVKVFRAIPQGFKIGSRELTLLELSNFLDSKAERAKSYRTLALFLHPDKASDFNIHGDVATSVLQLINSARDDMSGRASRILRHAYQELLTSVPKTAAEIEAEKAAAEAAALKEAEAKAKAKAEAEAARAQQEAEQKAKEEKARIEAWATNRYNSYDFEDEPDLAKRREKMQKLLEGVDALPASDPQKVAYKELLKNGIDVTAKAEAAAQKAAAEAKAKAEAAQKAAEAVRVQQEAEQKAREEKARIAAWATDRYRSDNFEKEPDLQRRREQMQALLKSVDGLVDAKGVAVPAPEKAAYKALLEAGINSTYAVASAAAPQVATTPEAVVIKVRGLYKR